MIRYNDWLDRGFLFVEARICEEFVDPFRRTMSEEYVRIAFIRGLQATAPTEAHRVRLEHPIPLHGASCVSHDAPIKGKGRALAADIVIDPAATGRQALVCELKWLKNTRKNKPTDRSAEVIQDLWKLALTRSTGAKFSTYLLVGGDAASFSATLKSLKKIGLKLNWSPAGAGGNSWPKPQILSLGARFEDMAPHLKKVLKRTTHFRHPPPCWWQVRLTLRNRWFRTMRNAPGWRVALWEMDHHGLSPDEIDWSTTLENFEVGCT
jgi:hypothetical protein